MTAALMVGSRWAERRNGRTARVIRIDGRCQPREHPGKPIVWKATVVAHFTPALIGRTVYVSDRTLRYDYRLETT